MGVETEHDRALGRVAEWLSRSTRVVAITGAGISAESGVPTFRGPGGFWRSYRPEDLATPEAFARDPSLVWEWYRWRRARVAAAEPNPGHLTLARFESRFDDFLLLTQNVDGLHGRAGSRTLIELHGNIWRARCVREPDRRFDEDVAGNLAPAAAGDTAAVETALPHCPCGALLRPDVVWFGEALDPAAMDAAVEAVRRCEVLLVIGTSAVVYPVAGLPSIARRAGAVVVEINVERTPLSGEADVVLAGPSGTILPALERLL